MSSDKKALKAFIKSFKKVKSISLVDKVTEKGKTVSNFLFSIESKEGKKSKFEKWMMDLTSGDEKKKSKKKDKKKKSKSDKGSSSKPKSSKTKAKKTEKKEVKPEVKPEKIAQKPAAKAETAPKPVEKVPAEAKKETPAKKASPVKKAPAKPKSVTTKASGDNLKIILGIGPAIEKYLKEDGINSFTKLAEANAEEIKTMLVAKGGTRYNANDPSTWPAQAAIAATGDKDKLTAYQDQLKEEK
ncbi:hypothetical protein [Jiulongibacter sp. NS-SX5]|uniref:hypothetical protein n=1 Tax=Jiulongibacter sp. NS-SX5 TaxID=3463854 RepID=UPI00405831DD